MLDQGERRYRLWPKTLARSYNFGLKQSISFSCKHDFHNCVRVCSQLERLQESSHALHSSLKPVDVTEVTYVSIRVFVHGLAHLLATQQNHKLQVEKADDPH